MDDLPVELLHEIAFDRPTFRALLAVPKFAKSLFDLATVSRLHIV
jgi:hypothetical protein